MSELLAAATEIVEKKADELSVEDLCYATFWYDQLTQELDDLIHTDAPKAQVDRVAKHLDEIITYMNAMVLYWNSVGYGKDEEQEFEIDLAWKEKKKQEKKNDIRNDYQL